MGGRGARGGAGRISADTAEEVPAWTTAASARDPERERPASAARSAASSSVFANRRAGSFWRQRVTSASSARGTSARSRLSGSGSRSITAARTWAGVSRRKSGRPVAISPRMSPTANWSVRWSTVRPLACSGDMYSSVPSSMPACVPYRDSVSCVSRSPSGASPILASPKSRIFRTPSGVTMRFSGFRSRWTIPARCAFARPSASCAPRSSSSGIGSGPRARRRRSVSPSTYSITT